MNVNQKLDRKKIKRVYLHITVHSKCQGLLYTKYYKDLNIMSEKI